MASSWADQKFSYDRGGTPWSLNRLFRVILNSLVAYFGGDFLRGFYPTSPPKMFPKHPQIVSKTPKMSPSNFLKKSLNRLLIDPGVILLLSSSDRVGRCGLSPVRCLLTFTHISGHAGLKKLMIFQ